MPQCRPLTRAVSSVLLMLSCCVHLHAQQVGDAYISFNYTTGEIRMSPGNAVSGSNGIDTFEVPMNPTVGTLSTNSGDYFFPSGSYLFPPQTGADPGNTFGVAFATYALPNVTGGGDSLNAANLVIGSAWAYPAAVPGSTAVYASTIPGYEGLPEFSFGFIGPITLTAAQALSALDATSQGGFATGGQVYTLSNKQGTQAFRVFTVPEPALLPLAGIAAVTILTMRLFACRRGQETMKG